MLSASRQGLGTGPAVRSGLRVPTVLAVAALHMALLSALDVLSHPRQAVPPPASISIPVVFMPPDTAPAVSPPEILAPSTLPVPGSVEPAALAPLPSLIVPPGQTASIRRATLQKPHPDQSRAASTQAPRSIAIQAPQPDAPPASRPAAAAASATSPHEALRSLDAWEARIRQAVQNAAIYPASARLLHREGSAQIRFDYNRGAIENAEVAQTSHFGSFDSAALAAVTHAAIPAPPAELGPQTRTMLVWVQFKLVGAE